MTRLRPGDWSRLKPVWTRWQHTEVDWTVGSKFSGRKDRMEKVYGRGGRPPGSERRTVAPPSELSLLYRNYLHGVMADNHLANFSEWVSRVGERFLNKTKFGSLTEFKLLAHLTHFGTKSSDRHQAVYRTLTNQAFWQHRWLPAFRHSNSIPDRRITGYDLIAPLRAWKWIGSGSSEVWSWWLDACQQNEMRSIDPATLVGILDAIVYADPLLDGGRLVENPCFVDGVMRDVWARRALTLSDEFTFRTALGTLAGWSSAGIQMPEELADMVMAKLHKSYVSFPPRSLGHMPMWLSRAAPDRVTSEHKAAYLAIASKKMHAMPPGSLPILLQGLLNMGGELPSHFVATWVDNIIPKIHHLSVDALLSVISIFRQIQTRPPRELLQVWGPQIQMALFTLNTLQLTQLMDDLMTLKITPEMTFAADWIRRAQVIAKATHSSHDRGLLQKSHAELVAIVEVEKLMLEDSSLFCK